ncbi:MAG TPA: 4Fe-4S dicluster domain-containing protein [Conexivisphaerales archaeon]|nr:4Fe-4S dicluster domain-containing protein [Conexivisphaerales archaeon]
MKCFIIDASICNGCYNCQIACKDEHVGNDWPPYALSEPDIGQFWVKVHERERGTVPKVRMTFMPLICNHCDNAPCMKAATGGAIYKRSDGIVIIDPVKSVGQKQLVGACPYGAIYWNSTLNIPQKCTGCSHLIDNAANTTDPGLQAPRCVDACPTGALTWGDDTDPAIQAKIAGAIVMHPEYQTKPRAYYLNVPTVFIAGAIYDKAADECLEGATVSATDLQTGMVYSATTDNYGDFWLEDVAPNHSYTVHIELDGYAPKTLGGVFTGKDVNLGDMELLPLK